MYVSSKQDRVSSAVQTLKILSKVLCYGFCVYQCLDIPMFGYPSVWISQWNTVSCVWYIACTCQINLKMSQNLKQHFDVFKLDSNDFWNMQRCSSFSYCAKITVFFNYTLLCICTWVYIYLLLFSPLRWRRSFLFSLIFGVPTFVIFITYVILDELERRPNQLILPGLSLENLLMFILCTPVQVSIDYTWN